MFHLPLHWNVLVQIQLTKLNGGPLKFCWLWLRQVANHGSYKKQPMESKRSSLTKFEQMGWQNIMPYHTFSWNVKGDYYTSFTI